MRYFSHVNDVFQQCFVITVCKGIVKRHHSYFRVVLFAETKEGSHQCSFMGIVVTGTFSTQMTGPVGQWSYPNQLHESASLNIGQDQEWTDQLQSRDQLQFKRCLSTQWSSKYWKGSIETASNMIWGSPHHLVAGRIDCRALHLLLRVWIVEYTHVFCFPLVMSMTDLSSTSPGKQTFFCC